MAARWRQLNFALSLPKQPLCFPLPLFNSPRIYGQHALLGTTSNFSYLGCTGFLHPKVISKTPIFSPKAALHVDDIPAFDVPEERTAQDLE